MSHALHMAIKRWNMLVWAILGRWNRNLSMQHKSSTCMHWLILLAFTLCLGSTDIFDWHLFLKRLLFWYEVGWRYYENNVSLPAWMQELFLIVLSNAFVTFYVNKQFHGTFLFMIIELFEVSVSFWNLIFLIEALLFCGTRIVESATCMASKNRMEFTYPCRWNKAR